MEKDAGQQETKPGGRFYPRQRKEKIVNVKGEESADASDGIPSLAHTHSRSHWRCLSVPEWLLQHGGISVRVLLHLQVVQITHQVYLLPICRHTLILTNFSDQNRLNLGVRLCLKARCISLFPSL